MDFVCFCRIFIIFLFNVNNIWCEFNVIMFSIDVFEFDILDFVLEKIVFDFNLGFFLNFLGKYLNSRGVKSLNMIDDVYNSYMVILIYILFLIFLL